ncbi:MAG UNVERIFIED_CONTAM: DUF1553 domain-containing protein [Planctomycetaceae bacterium]
MSSGGGYRIRCWNSWTFPTSDFRHPRGQSVSPLQALTLMNNRFVLHHAEHLAQRALRGGADVDAQVASAVSFTWQRQPNSAELDSLARLARDHGMSAVARLLLNSAEFLIVD